MNWFEMMNQTSNYIEEHITDQIDLSEIAKQNNVSYSYFSKIFSMMSGYTLKEYIRNRRITLASYEISNTKQRIIDIALKYGYSSNESFSRAFKVIHGINPKDARKNHVTLYTHFPILQYDIPKRNMISLRYDIIWNHEYHFLGSHIPIQEEDYQETQNLQTQFVIDFQKKHPLNDTLYRVHTNLSKSTLEYDYFAGYDRVDFYSEDSSLIALDLTIHKGVRFIANSIHKSMIPEIKAIIYDEWKKNGFTSDQYCEIEFITKKDNDLIDFHYLVSIQEETTR